MTARGRGALMQRAVAAASQGARVTGQARRCMYRSDVSKRIDSFCGISGPDGPISGRGQLGEHAPGVFWCRACQIWGGDKAREWTSRQPRASQWQPVPPHAHLPLAAVKLATAIRRSPWQPSGHAHPPPLPHACPCHHLALPAMEHNSKDFAQRFHVNHAPHISPRSSRTLPSSPFPPTLLPHLQQSCLVLFSCMFLSSSNPSQ